MLIILEDNMNVKVFVFKNEYMLMTPSPPLPLRHLFRVLVFV